ncbi:hypothetical protein [Indioceanicola profundi]|uniref:hypothetical protein n=1 Tax=Indioceanicola profundi TaxID=2220096 RepID=UPI0013C45190|nr:hypothetical protein [Indioceanicola profundi]
MQRKSVQSLMRELERHGVQLQDGRFQLSGEAPASLLLRAHRNRRALLAASRGRD